MAVPSQSLPTVGQPNASEDPKIRSALSELQTILTGGVDVTNISTATLQLLGLTNGTQVGRGISVNAGSSTRSSAAYGALADAADQVQNVVVASNALVFVYFDALMKSTTNGNGRAAIFIGANQLKISGAGGIPITQAAATTVETGFLTRVSSCPVGLACSSNGTGVDETSVATGMALMSNNYGSGTTMKMELGGVVAPVSTAATPYGFYGGACVIRGITPGTYTFSVQYKTTDALALTAQARTLMVETRTFS